MKKLGVALGLALFLVGGTAAANDQYHVYRKKGDRKCEIDTRDHAKFGSARGSGWTCVGHGNYRLDAEKIFKNAGCAK